MAAPEDKRYALARELCEGDIQLLEEVTELLANAAAGKGDTLDAAIKDAVGVVAQEVLGHHHENFTGQQIGQYQLLGLLGQGGMGQVYEAFDNRLERHVALKILLEQGNAKWRRRFHREARMVAALNHPNIVTLHAIEEHGGKLILVMELLEGRTLEHFISPEGMDLETFWGLASGILKALAEAHAKGIVHRDLKPANIMVDDRGLVKVLDFGLARSLNNPAHTRSNQSTLTSTGQIMGTCHYMSPEQARGKSVDQRCDLFSLGIIFFEMLSGQRPFTGETSSDIISAILKDDPPEVATAKIPPALQKMVTRCLAKDPTHRYKDANDLQQEMHGLGPASKHKRKRGAHGRAKVRVKPILMGLALGLILVSFAAYKFYWHCPAPDQKLIEGALNYYKNGALDKATLLLEDAVEQNPKFALAWANLSIFYTAKGFSKRARDAAQMAVNLERCLADRPERHFAHGLLLMHHQQFEKARDRFLFYLGKTEGSANLYRQLAHCFFRLEDPPKQIEAYKKARDLEPDNTMVLGGYLSALIDNNDLERFRTELALIRGQPDGDSWYSYWAEGLADLCSGNLNDAARAFETMRNKCLEEDGGESTRSWAVHNLARVDVLRGQFREAAKRLEDGQFHDIQNGQNRQLQEKRIWLARLYFWLGKPSLAMEKLATAVADIELIPGNIRWIRQAALTYISLGRPEEARALLKEIASIEDSFPSVTSHCFAAHVRGALLLAEGELEAAQFELQSALNKLPDSWCKYTLALVLEKRGRDQDALNHYYEIVERRTGRVMHQDFPDYWVFAHHGLARCYRNLGKNEDARPYAKKFLEMWSEPSLPGVKEAQGWTW